MNGHAGRLLLAIAFAAAFVAGLVGVPAATQAQDPTPTPRSPQSPCFGTVTGTLAAESVRLCDDVDVTVRLEPSCPICPGGINVVYIQVEEATEAPWMSDVAVRSLTEIEAASQNHEFSDVPISVGVVHYTQYSDRIALPMTEKLGQARGVLRKPVVGTERIGRFIPAATLALSMLRTAREENTRASEFEPCEVVVFFASTKRPFEITGREMIRAAQMIRREQGVTLIVGCPETDADYCYWTKQMASSMALYTEFPEGTKLSRLTKDELQDFLSRGGVRDLSLTQQLPTGLTYVDGSASEPPQVEALGDQTTLRWDWTRLRETAPHTVTYQVRPADQGRWSIDGALQVTDRYGLDRVVPMASMPITVTGSCLPDTPTPSPTATSTATATPPPTSTATATLTPTPTPTLQSRPLYLPVALREVCLPSQQHVDVVLVLDASTSMLQPTERGGSKLEAARAAAAAFLGQLRLDDGDQASIVTFNSDAQMAQHLTADRGALDTALAGIEAAPQTWPGVCSGRRG